MLVSFLARLLLLLPEISHSDANRLEQFARSQQEHGEREGGQQHLVDNIDSGDLMMFSHPRQPQPANNLNAVNRTTSKLQRANVERKRTGSELRIAVEDMDTKKVETMTQKPEEQMRQQQRCKPIDDRGRKQLIQVGRHRENLLEKRKVVIKNETIITMEHQRARQIFFRSINACFFLWGHTNKCLYLLKQKNDEFVFYLWMLSCHVVWRIAQKKNHSLNRFMDYF